MERIASWLGVIAVVVGGAVYAWRSAPPQVPVTVPAAIESTTESHIVVHVSGAVVNPGVVRVPAASRVVDVVAAAGGVTHEAELSAINLASPVSDGDQVIVPVEAGPMATDDGRVSLNQATVSEMEALPGVGPVLAGRIVAYREANGPFTEIEDLLDVPGIGESKLASLRDAVRIP